MDSRTGEIINNPTPEEIERRNLQVLTPDTYQALKNVVEEDRPRELALIEYRNKIKGLGRKVSPYEIKAFRVAWDLAKTTYKERT